MTRSRAFLLATAAAALLLTSACSDGPNDPVVRETDVVGAYHATSFTLTFGGPTENLLAAGAILDVTLADDHTTSGRLAMPTEDPRGEEIVEDLGGSWRLSRDTVYFTGAADTFIHNVPFVVGNGTLSADATSAGERLRVTLTKE